MKMKCKTLIFLFFLPFAIGDAEPFGSYRSEYSSPSHLISVDEWKLQFPGGETMGEEKKLLRFSSKYYFLERDENGTEWIHFALDAADKGHSKNTKYVRSELRHIKNWQTGGTRRMSYTFRAWASEPSSKFTVGQIHIVGDDSVIQGEHSPFVRIVIVGTKVRAWIKNFSDGTYDSPVIGEYKAGSEMKVVLETVGKRLNIYLDGKLVFSEEKSCPFKNYFKIGVYPQQTHGFFDVLIKDLKVEID